MGRKHTHIHTYVTAVNVPAVYVTAVNVTSVRVMAMGAAGEGTPSTGDSSSNTNSDSGSMSSSSNTNSNGDALDEGTVSSYNSNITTYKSKFVLLIIKLDGRTAVRTPPAVLYYFLFFLLVDCILT